MNILFLSYFHSARTHSLQIKFKAKSSLSPLRI